ncbi:MAG: proprotein convertase P-domain-containing protein [Myxococcota bacterium]
MGEFEDGTSFGDPVAPPAGGDETSGGGDTGSLTTGVTAFPPTSGTTDPDPSEVTTDPTSEPDPSTTGEATTAADSSSSGGAVGEASSGDGVECGNGVLEEGEQCDGDDFGGTTCEEAGDFTGGSLACSELCVLDRSGCTEPTMDPVEVCENTNLAIPDNGAPVTVTPTVPPGGTVSNVTVSVTLTHTFIGDLTIDVTHSGTTVRVYNEECGVEDNMELSFDDDGAAIACAASTSGAATLPTESLTAFDGDAAGGAWEFSFQDNAALDEGSVSQVCVRVE